MNWAGLEAALDNVWALVTDCVEFITTNAALMVIFAASLVPIGFKIFRRARKSVK